jgi:hypothetical protein
MKIVMALSATTLLGATSFFWADTGHDNQMNPKLANAQRGPSQIIPESTVPANRVAGATFGAALNAALTSGQHGIASVTDPQHSVTAIIVSTPAGRTVSLKTATGAQLGNWVLPASATFDQPTKVLSQVMYASGYRSKGKSAAHSTQLVDMTAKPNR